MTPSILVVEDDEDLRTLIVAILRGVGYNVVHASNGQEALELVRANRPAMILLDMRMPIMDGWAFVAELRADGESPPPIIVLTAATDPASRAAEVEADAWLAKPFDASKLVAIARRFAEPQPHAQ